MQAEKYVFEIQKMQKKRIQKKTQNQNEKRSKQRQNKTEHEIRQI